MHAVSRETILSLTGCVLALMGCAANNSPTSVAKVDDAAGWKPLLTSSHPGVRREIALIREELEQAEAPTVDPATTARPTLASVMRTANISTLSLVAKQLQAGEGTPFSQKVTELLRDVVPQYRELRENLENAETDLAINPAHVPRQKWDDECVDLCAALYMLPVCLAMSDQEGPALVASSTSFLAIGARLEASGDLESRLRVGRWRTMLYQRIIETCEVPEFKTHIATLERLLTDDHARRIPAAGVWRAERRRALAIYALVRREGIASFLAEEQWNELKAQAKAETTREFVQQRLDDDLAFYLLGQRELVTAAEQSPAAEAIIATRIEERLKQLNGTPDFPFVAGKLLWSDLSSARGALEREEQRYVNMLKQLRSIDGGKNEGN